MRKFLIGAAAIALAASGAIAQPGNGKGGGNDKGGGKDHAAMGHGGGKPDKGNSGGGQAKADRGQGQQRAERGPEVRQARQEARQAERRSEARGNGNGNRAERAVSRQVERAERRVDRAVERRDRDVVEVRDIRNDRRGDDGRVTRTVWFDDGRRGLIDGCPPGLAKKNNGCMPPGLAKQRDMDWRQSYYQPSWWGYDRLSDGRYFYDDGYLYRMGNNNSVLGYIPLLGGALSVGNPWPSYYDPYPVPQYYQDYYNLGPANSYRYADDVLYRVDPQTGMIDSIAALLTGDQWAIGQQMPLGYDVYNVPYGYQDQYYDTPDSMYRYSDGYVYQVDPTTQLVQAVIELLL